MGGNYGWEMVLDVGILSCFLLLGAFMRAYLGNIIFFRFLQNYLVPVALIGGFMAMLSNDSFFGLITFDNTRLGIYVYHLLSITFVAMGLRKPTGEKGRDAVAMGLSASTGYALQGIVGFSLGLLLMYTIYPDLFPAFGFLAPLGFGQGPGQTFSIAHEWEMNFGFTHGGNLGLTMAAFGYFWACFIGVIVVNYGIKKGWAQQVKDKSHLSREVYTGFLKKDSERPVAGRLTTSSEALETLALHVALIGFVYIITYLMLSGVTYLLNYFGAGGFAMILRGFFFIFAALLALLTRVVMQKIGLSHIVDNDIMSRIAGFTVDFLVVAAIAAISLPVVVEFIVPILVTGVGVGLITLLMVFWYAKRSFQEYPFERAIAIYGMLTGTISTGLVLLRMVDPEYKTPVAQHLVYTSAISLPLCFPLLLLINRPVMALAPDHKTIANPGILWETLLLVGVMFLVLLVVYRLTGLIKFKRPWRKIWLKD